MDRVAVLTGSELRHTFVRMAIAAADRIDVLRSYCEGVEGTTIGRAREEGSEVKLDHLERRARSERDFFGPFVALVNDCSNPRQVDRGAINGDRVHRDLVELGPDLVVAYGCSLIEDPLLSTFEGRLLNCHLGLSPYYRGTGTNFWPLVNGEPEYVGATFMYVDEGVDTGEIIHQIRARVYPEDTPHQIGNRLIGDMAQHYIEIVRRFDELEPVDPPAEPETPRYYRTDDYTEEATETLYANFESGLVDRYIRERSERTAEAPIVTNPALEDVDVLSPRYR